MPTTKLSRALKKYRSDNNLNQIDTAKKLNISQSALSAYERGEPNRQPRIDVIVRIAKVIGTTPFHLEPALHQIVPKQLQPLITNWNNLTKKEQATILNIIKKRSWK